MWVKTEKGFVNLAYAQEVYSTDRGQPKETWRVYANNEPSFPILKEELPKVFSFIEDNSL
jgi:hypothetical protein